MVLDRARETLRAYNNIRESVAELKGETSGKLRLGVIPTVAPYLLHKFIPAFVRDYPKVELEISEMVTSDIVEARSSATGSTRHLSPAARVATVSSNRNFSTTVFSPMFRPKTRCTNGRTSASRTST